MREFADLLAMLSLTLISNLLCLSFNLGEVEWRALKT